MSENLDAQLSASYDAAQGGTPSIDTSGGTIAPDTRDRPGDGRPVDLGSESAAEHRERSEAMEAELGHAFDLSMRRQERQEGREMPPISHFEFPTGMTDANDKFRLAIEKTMEAKFDWDAMPKTEQQAMSRGLTQIAEIKAAAQAAGVKCETAADIVALRGLVHGDNAQAAPDPEFDKFAQTYVPHAASRSEALAELNKAAEHYQGWERHIAANPQQGLRDYAQARGVHPVNMLTEAEAMQITLSEMAHAQGLTQGQLLERAGFMPAEAVQQHVEQAASVALLDSWAATKSDFQDVRLEMAAVIRNDKREYKSEWEMLESVYQQVRKGRSRSRPKTKLHQDIEAAAERAYSR